MMNIVFLPAIASYHFRVFFTSNFDPEVNSIDIDLHLVFLLNVPACQLVDSIVCGSMRSYLL